MNRSIMRRVIRLAAMAFAFVILVDVGRAASPDDDVKALGSTKHSEQQSAAARLEKSPKDSIPALLNGLDDENERVRDKSLRVLRQIKWTVKSLYDDRIATKIGEKCRSEKDPHTRVDLVMALADLRGSVVAHELKRLASEDSDEEVRRLATHHVARVVQDPKQEIQFFRKQTGDRSGYVQLAAYSELAKLGDKSGRDLALRTLRETAPDDERAAANPERDEAMQLLGFVGRPEDIPLLRAIASAPMATGHERAYAYKAYKHNELLQLPPDQRLPLLIKTLDDPDENVRDWAYVELYNSPDPNTNARLKKYLKEPGHKGYAEAAHALDVR